MVPKKMTIKEKKRKNGEFVSFRLTHLRATKKKDYLLLIADRKEVEKDIGSLDIADTKNLLQKYRVNSRIKHQCRSRVSKRERIGQD